MDALIIDSHIINKKYIEHITLEKKSKSTTYSVKEVDNTYYRAVGGTPEYVKYKPINTTDDADRIVVYRELFAEKNTELLPKVLASKPYLERQVTTIFIWVHIMLSSGKTIEINYGTERITYPANHLEKLDTKYNTIKDYITSELSETKSLFKDLQCQL